MKTATLEQFEKLMAVVLGKIHGMPSEQMQSLIESGALSDVFEANFNSFDREAHRKVLGLKPLNPPAPPLLIALGTSTVFSTVTPFVARKHFVQNTDKKAPVKISFVSDYFKECFYGKTEDVFGGSTLNYGKLSRSSVDGPIIAELGGEAKSVTTLTEIYSLMEVQPNGESGPLLTNGYANIFYVRDVKGVLRAVGVCWSGGGWYVGAGGVARPSAWDDGRQVFSRNS
jgi:hypothetical protein